MRCRPVALPDSDDDVAATSEALRLLARAAQTEAGLRHRLRLRGFSAATAGSTAAEMMRRGLLDEDAYAGAVVERRLRRGQGRAHIAAELRVKGVGERAIDEALRGIGATEEAEAAMALARRMFAKAAAAPGDPRGTQRLAGALARRGFDFATIRRALQEVGIDEAHFSDGP